MSDISPSLRITKTIAVPNLTAFQVQQAILSDPQLTQDLCRCLGTTDPAAITGLCLCSDQLSDPKTPWDVNSDVLMELENWWKRRVAGAGPDSHMTPVLYKTLIARFCGPATTVTVPCTSPPRLCVKTLGQAVFLTGQCYTAQITLFPEQVDLLNNAPQRLFIAGPPGTGKTVMLLLVGTEWLRRRIQVNIVCTGRWSRVACRMVYHLLLHTINTQQVAVPLPGLLKLHQYDFSDGKDVEKAVSDLSQMANEGSLYVIADQVASEQSPDYYFKEFCEKLLARIPNLHLWAATCYHGNAPAGWQTESLTRPLRSPPVIVREIEQDWAITRSKEVQAYSERGVPDHTDGPPVTQLTHRGQDHSGHVIGECITCGREVASFLNSLHIGVQFTAKTVTGVPTSGSTPPTTLQWRDVLLLHSSGVGDKSAVVMAMRNAAIPVQVMKEADHEDVAIARSDVVWVADAKLIRGVERKVVVCLQTNLADLNVRLHAMSRCTSQLVIFSTDRPLDTGLDHQADTQAQEFADFL